MNMLTIALFIGTIFSCFGAATSGHDAHQELLDAIYTLDANPREISYPDFMAAKRHHPDVAMAVRQCMGTTKGNRAMQLHSSSLSIGKKVVITCHIAGLNLAEQLLRIKPDVVNMAHDIVQSVCFHWNVSIMAKDVMDKTSQHLPTGKQFGLALCNAKYYEYTNIAALCIVSSQHGATAYFMKQQPRIDQEQVRIASKEMQWLGKESARAMAKQRQRWILKLPDMKIQTTVDPAATPLDPSTFDFAFDIDGKAIADYFASQTSDSQREPKRQRRA